MRKTDEYRIGKIIEVAEKLASFIRDNPFTLEDLTESYSLQWTLSTPMYNIGEQVYCLSKEFKDGHPEIRWTSIAGMRHRLVHEYEDVDWEIVFLSATEDVPELLSFLKSLQSSDGAPHQNAHEPKDGLSETGEARPRCS